MPPSLVPRRVEDIIYYYYAKLVISPSAGFKGNYRFIVDTYQRLKRGEIHMSDYHRELLHIAQQPGVCSYCGTVDPKVIPNQVIALARGGPIGIHNMVLACDPCVSSKAEHDLVHWWCRILGRERDEIPRVPLGLYLKLAYEAHHVGFTLGESCSELGELFGVPRSSAHKAGKRR